MNEINSTRNTRQIITVVTVTYGNRTQIVKQTILPFLTCSSGDFRVVVVANGAAAQTLDLLDSLAQRFPDRLEVVSFAENQGSAAAFAAGLQTAYRSGGPLLVLDDDNPIDPTQVLELRTRADRLQSRTPNPVATAVYRPMNPGQTMFINGVPDWYLYRELRPGAFQGFELASTLRRRKHPQLTPPSEDSRRSHEVPGLIRMRRAMWGGLFLTARGAQLGVLPNVDLVLYTDDNDFSDKFFAAGGQIFLDTTIQH